jgi:hypothetical protein
MYFVRGASFDKKEFKRNLPGSGAYAPGGSTVGNTILVRLELWDLDSI